MFREVGIIAEYQSIVPFSITEGTSVSVEFDMLKAWEYYKNFPYNALVFIHTHNGIKGVSSIDIECMENISLALPNSYFIVVDFEKFLISTADAYRINNRFVFCDEYSCTKHKSGEMIITTCPNFKDSFLGRDDGFVKLLYMLEKLSFMRRTI